MGFTRTADGILLRRSVLKTLREARISGWRPGHVEIDTVEELSGYDTKYDEMIVIGHTRGYSDLAAALVKLPFLVDRPALWLYNQTGIGRRWREAGMIKTIEAVIDEQGKVRLLESIRLPAVRRALVTILEEAPLSGVSETALLSEAALAKDWNRPEEDAAWSHLQSAQ